RFVRVSLRLGPVTPGMALERVLSEGRQVGDELLANRVGERRGDADVVQRAILVVEAEQKRADHRAGAVLVPAEAGDHTVGGAREGPRSRTKPGPARPGALPAMRPDGCGGAAPRSRARPRPR